MLLSLLIVGLGLVAANPILQRIPIQIPGQSCPSQTCPTCPTQTCPTQTCPTQTCPTSRAPCQTCQNYRNYPQPIVVRPSNNYPCNKQVQNPVANPISQDILSQLVMRRLLVPQPQMQANPPAKTCNHCEAQKPVPNIINNYIIIPPEYFKGNETKTDKDDSVKRRRKGKRRKQSRQKNQQSLECPCEVENIASNGVIGVGKLCPCDETNNSRGIPETAAQTDKTENTPSKPNTAVEQLLPKSAPNLKTTNTSQDYKVANSFPEVSSKKEHTENNDLERPRKGNRERTRTLEEAIIKDFCKKHPTIPEEIARSLLKKLKHQTDINERSYYHPYPYSPFDYGRYDPKMFYQRDDEYSRAYNDEVARRSRKRKPNGSGRRNKKRKEEIQVISENLDKKSEKLVETKPAVINIETETITTEKIIATTANKFKDNLPKNDSETQVETPNDLLDQLDQMKAKFAKLNEIGTTTVNYNKRIEQYPELGKEDKVPTVYNNGVYDYFPDFRGDTIPFYASDEECDSKEDTYRILESKRYVNTKKSNNKSYKYETSTEQPFPVSTEAYDSCEDSKDESEEIRFIIPPHLELPDFETKEYVKDYQINEKFVADDSITPEIQKKPAKVFTKDKSGRTNIETVYGHSRVIKYGHGTEAAASEPVITYYLPEEAMTEDHIQLPDEGAIVVVAKSIQDIEDHWE